MAVFEVFSLRFPVCHRRRIYNMYMDEPAAAASAALLLHNGNSRKYVKG